MGNKRRRLIAGAVSLALLVPESTSFQHPNSASNSAPLTRPPATRLSAATTDRALERPHKAAQRAYEKAASSPLVISNRRTNTQLQPIPVTGYNAKEIAEYYDRRPLEVGWRLNSLSLPLLGWYIGLLSDKLWGVDKREDIQRMRGAELRMHLVRSGSVALVKSGQALSLRPDLLKNKIWADELGKLVDAVGSFSDIEAMDIMRKELSDLLPKLKGLPMSAASTSTGGTSKRRLNKLEKMVENDPILSLFEFYNDNQAIASASIGQCYKARIRRGPRLEAAIGKAEAERWGGRIVAIKVQRPDAAASASLDMYLIRRAAEWLSKFRGGGLPAIADQFGMQLFGELDYKREANNCERTPNNSACVLEHLPAGNGLRIVRAIFPSFIFSNT